MTTYTVTISYKDFNSATLRASYVFGEFGTDAQAERLTKRELAMLDRQGLRPTATMVIRRGGHVVGTQSITL